MNPLSGQNNGQKLQMRFEEALVASGLVDDVENLQALDPRPYRFTEGEYVCHRGDLASCLWVIVSGAVSVRDEQHTLFVRHRHEVVGEQNLLGNGCQRWYDLVVSERNAELLRIDKHHLDTHPTRDILWRNIASIISLKLKKATRRNLELSHQIEDDTRILHAYTNEYALGRRLQFGGVRSTDHRLEQAVIWFSDVVNFSGYVLELAPERTADIVQRFFNAQSLPIQEHGGYIDKFMGDGLMAFWIVEDDQAADNVCGEAVKAAEAAVAAVSNIRLGTDPLQLRIGLHLGTVLTGDFGSATRHQFTLIGREVNKAARLEQVEQTHVIEGAHPIGSIRLSPEVRNRLFPSQKSRYSVRLRAVGKHVGEIELFVADGCQAGPPAESAPSSDLRAESGGTSAAPGRSTGREVPRPDRSSGRHRAV